MKTTFINLTGLRRSLYRSRAGLGILSLAGVLFANNNISAQTTNAYDTAADPVYGGSLSTGQNGGSGFGAWTVTVNGTGGSYTTGGGPSGDSWGLWNMSAHGSSVAVRPFASALVPGQSFSFYSQLNNMFNNDDTNAMVLQDASGNTIFSYWHDGFEANSANGSYSDATTSDGAAVGFDYHYNQFCSFTFTLNSATTYTFADNTTGHSFTGHLSGAPIAQVAFVRANGNGANAFVNGGDFRLDELLIESSAPPTFIAQTPTPGSYSASRTNISLEIIAGGAPLNTNTISLQVDNGIATVPSAVSTVAATTTIGYLLGSPLSGGVLHTVQVMVADVNGNLFTNAWSFTTGAPTLPVTLPGPISDSDNGGSGVVIFNASGDGWIGTNYESNSSQTLYARFSMVFQNLNGESGGGGGFGGLEFYQDNTERSIYGNNWLSLNWSLDVNGQPLDQDLTPVTPIVFDQYNTIVVRIDYQDGANANVKVWLNPDFTQTEDNQPNPPVQLSFDNTFDQIHLRCGNGTASATWTNIIMAATSAGIGFAPPVVAQFQGFIPGMNAGGVTVNSPIGAQVIPGSVGISTNDITVSLDGLPVTPVYSIATNNIITISYQPTNLFSAGSGHTVSVNLTDKNGTSYSTSWGFTVDQYPALPLTQAGPFDPSTGSDVILYDAQNEWIGGNYGATSTKTLYTLFSMTFSSLNGETGGGGGFGGLEFFEGAAEHFLIGNNWLSTNWSVSVDSASTADIPPVTPIVLGELHTFLIKCVYAGTNDVVSVWLDPDLTKTAGNQPNPPLLLTIDNTFDNIHLRVGNGNAADEFTNIVFAATAQGVGLPAQPAQAVLSLNSNLQLSWNSIGTLQSAPTPTGPWSDSAIQANPQTISATSTNQFFRLRQ